MADIFIRDSLIIIDLIGEIFTVGRLQKPQVVGEVEEDDIGRGIPVPGTALQRCNMQLRVPHRYHGLFIGMLALFFLGPS